MSPAKFGVGSWSFWLPLTRLSSWATGDEDVDRSVAAILRASSDSSFKP